MLTEFNGVLQEHGYALAWDAMAHWGREDAQQVGPGYCSPSLTCRMRVQRFFEMRPVDPFYTIFLKNKYKVYRLVTSPASLTGHNPSLD
jgi:hypothetical protein